MCNFLLWCIILALLVGVGGIALNLGWIAFILFLGALQWLWEKITGRE